MSEWWELLIEAREAVEDINSAIAEALPEDTWLTAEAKTNGNSIIVKFAGEMLWSEESDERNFIDEENDYEPLKPYIIKKYNKLIDSISKLRRLK